MLSAFDIIVYFHTLPTANVYNPISGYVDTVRMQNISFFF